MGGDRVDNAIQGFGLELIVVIAAVLICFVHTETI
jgi:hypothetical protein